MSITQQARPAWTFNNPGAFIYWMKTGADELPADWVDDADIPNPPAMRGQHETEKLLSILDELKAEEGEQ